MSRKLLNSIVIPGIVLLAAACAQQGQQEAPPAEEAAPVAETPMPEAATMGMPLELTPEKVNELANLAVQMEWNPTMTADLLAQHGMTQEQVNDAMTRIAADPALQTAFDTAKAAAAAAKPPAEGAPAGEAPAEGGH